MPKTKDLNLAKYGISQALYRELLWFCLQYKEKRAKLSSCYGLSAVSYNIPVKGSWVSDPTARKAELAEVFKADLDMIDLIAKSVCPNQTQLFLQSITEQHITYTTIRMHGFKMAHGEFNKKRQYFFYLLAIRMKKI